MSNCKHQLQACSKSLTNKWNKSCFSFLHLKWQPTVSSFDKPALKVSQTNEISLAFHFFISNENLLFHQWIYILYKYRTPIVSLIHNTSVDRRIKIDWRAFDCLKVHQPLNEYFFPEINGTLALCSLMTALV